MTRRTGNPEPYQPVVRNTRRGTPAGKLDVTQGQADQLWYVTQVVAPSKLRRFIDGPFETQREAETARREWLRGIRGAP